MKIVRQDGIKDCGVCCLLSIIKFYGGELSLEYLRGVTNTSKSGVSALDLIDAVKKIGFDAYGVAGDLEKIEVSDLPCIAHLIINKKYKHFVVIYGIDSKKRKVVVMDPAIGKRVLNFSQFRLLSSNNYIYLKPIKRLPKMSNKHIINKFIKDLLNREKISLLFIFLFTIFYFLFQVIIAFHFKYLLEFSIKYQLNSTIVSISIYLFIVYLFRELSLFNKNILMTKLMSISDRIMSFETYKHILLLPYTYYKNRTTGEVISRLKDLNTIKSFIAQVSCFFITDFIGVILFILILFKINFRMTAIILVFSMIVFLYSLFFSKKRKKLVKKVSRNEDYVNSYLVESLMNVDTIKGSHMEKRLRDKFLFKYNNLLDITYSFSFMEQVINLFKTIFSDILFVIVLGIGSYLVIIKKLSLGEVLVYQNIFGYYLNNFNSLISIFNNYHNFKVASFRVEDLFLIDSEEFGGSYYYLSHRLDGDISFNNLNYSISNKFILKELTLDIKYGEKILLFGKSGVGKSTLVKILLRYIEVPFGHVSIKGIDINHYHLEVIRQGITFVSSNELLFTNTLYNNIVLDREVSHDNFVNICKMCMVDEIVDDDLGYQVLVEENGFNFSNGERQRIILARALLRKSDIYIFDEAFSQIDNKRRSIIVKNIFEYLKEKTIIVISHNMNNKDIFNRILKMEDGGIIET